MPPAADDPPLDRVSAAPPAAPSADAAAAITAGEPSRACVGGRARIGRGAAPPPAAPAAPSAARSRLDSGGQRPRRLAGRRRVAAGRCWRCRSGSRRGSFGHEPAGRRVERGWRSPAAPPSPAPSPARAGQFRSSAGARWFGIGVADDRSRRGSFGRRRRWAAGGDRRRRDGCHRSRGRGFQPCQASFAPTGAPPATARAAAGFAARNDGGCPAGWRYAHSRGGGRPTAPRSRVSTPPAATAPAAAQRRWRARGAGTKGRRRAARRQPAAARSGPQPPPRRGTTA